MDRETSANKEFNTTEIFRKLISKSEPQTALGRTQLYFAEMERRADFLRELGTLCMKYGVGGISELEYHNEVDSSYVIINWIYGQRSILIRKNDDIITILRSIFEAVSIAKK